VELVFDLLGALNLLVVAIDGALILLDLLLIALVLLLFLTLHVIADERPGAESEGATDCRASAWVTNGCADNASRSSPAERAYAGSLFTGGQRAARATCQDDSRQRECRQLSPHVSCHFVSLLGSKTSIGNAQPLLTSPILAKAARMRKKKYRSDRGEIF
jgi:hypothetical protein